MMTQRDSDRLFSVAQKDFRRRLRRLSREIAPRLVNTSRREFLLIYQGAVTMACSEIYERWGAKISGMPAGALRRLSRDTPSADRRRD